MKYMYTHLTKKFPRIHISYIEYTTSQKLLDITGTIHMFDPVDHNVRKRFLKAFPDIILVESPSFIASYNMLKSYKDLHNSHKRYTHGSFYEYMKHTLNGTLLKGVLDGIPNLDRLNRNPPKTAHTKEQIARWSDITTQIFYDEAKTYAQSELFSKHYGSSDNVDIYPICKAHVQKALRIFLQKRFADFGSQQDAICSSDIIMNHSCLSACINIGIITPEYIVKAAISYWQKHKTTVPLQSLEGYIRQIIGWREYMRFLYEFHYEDMIAANISGNAIKRIPKSWYTGTTGIHPIDTEIKKVLDYGYAHHIVRLMVFMNAMILHGFHPQAIYTWFMQMISIDAYDWVMIPNVYAMGFFWNKAMRKPYISTSQYISRMSDYKGGKDTWKKQWDSLFRTYVAKAPKEYVQFYR
jgi:deoxyribodipyrimidine photolyase-related protein